MNFPACTVHRLTLLIAVACGLITSASAQWKEKVLYSFQGGTDGALPAGGLIHDKLGVLYGMTTEGGSTSCPPGWCGTVYELSPPSQTGGAWTETLLYVFKGHDQNDGSSPSGSLIADGEGNLYGVTGYGGSGPCVLFGTATGCGTVFELSPPVTPGAQWTETVLYSFQGGNDGDLPTGPLVADQAGNLYGATEFGGGQGTTCDLFYGGNCGTIFELSPPLAKGGQWTENVVHSFSGNNDGAVPNEGVVLDAKGAVYGTTSMGGNQLCNFGNGNIGCGIVFRLGSPNQAGQTWSESILRFNGGNQGAGPDGLAFGASATLYGTAASGGLYLSGLVFQLGKSKDNKLTWSELYDFTGGQDGDGPSGLTLDSLGNLYGTAFGGISGRGVVFRLTRPKSGNFWPFVLLYNFTGTTDGHWPQSGITFDQTGNLYGTTSGGGSGNSCSGGCGTVYEILR